MVAGQSPFTGGNSRITTSPNIQKDCFTGFYAAGVEGNPDSTHQWAIKTEKHVTLSGSVCSTQIAMTATNDDPNIYFRICWFGTYYEKWRKVSCTLMPN